MKYKPTVPHSRGLQPQTQSVITTQAVFGANNVKDLFLHVFFVRIAGDNEQTYEFVPKYDKSTGTLEYELPEFALDLIEGVSKGPLVQRYLDWLFDGVAGSLDHGSLLGLLDDDHPQYSLVNGTRAFTGTVGGITPTLPSHLTTKAYVDSIAMGGLSWQEVVIDKISTPPGAPSVGDRYVIDVGGTGAWLGQDDKIAEWDGASWTFFTPSEGWAVFIDSLNTVQAYDAAYPGGTWANLGSFLDHGNLIGLGDDDHTQYILANGTRAFTGVVVGVSPTLSSHLTTRGYVEANFATTSHKNTHVIGGSDAFISTDIIDAIVKRVQETSGPTTLDFGTIAVGEVLIRSGATIIGATTGSLATITVQDEGVGIVGNPHTTLNFVGTNVTATDAGGGVATITIGGATTSHKDTHVIGGSDAFISTDHIDAIVRRIRETSGPTTLDFGSIADGEFLRRSGSTVIGGGAFGTQFNYDEDLTLDTTTSTTYQNKLTYTTPTLPIGTYLLIWAFNYSNSDPSGSEFQGRVTVDASEIWSIRQEPQDGDVNQSYPAMGFDQQVFGSAATHTINIDYRRQGSFGTSRISDTRIAIWRVA